MNKTLTLDIVTQEKRLLTVEAQQVTLETTAGEITILPEHIPLISRLERSLLRYIDTQGDERVVAIFGGFLEYNSNNKLSILADSAVRAEDIDLAAIKRAEQEALSAEEDKSKARDFTLAQAAIHRATLKNTKRRHRS